MLVDAPAGAVTTFASWYARTWSQEPITLQSFVHLPSIRRFFVDETKQLPALFEISLKYQDEVTEALGEQVRCAVEVLIQTLNEGTVVGRRQHAAFYKGTGPAVTDVAGGHIYFTVTTIASTLAQRGSGKINYVAVLAPQQASFLPEVPTLAEQGLPEADSTGWWGILGPPNMPKALVQDLNTAIRTAMSSPEVEKSLTTLPVDPWIGSPDDFDKFIRKQAAQTIQLAKKAGIEQE